MASPQTSFTTSTKTSARPRRLPEKPAQAQPLAARALPQKRLSHEEAIRQRAHQIYLERGDSGNDPLGDWLQAEREYWYSLGRPEKAVWRGPHSPVP